MLDLDVYPLSPPEAGRTEETMKPKDGYDGKFWKMPGWMEPYRRIIGDTGGNPVEELVNDRTTKSHSNVIRAMLCVAVKDQVDLLYRLARMGALKGAPEDAAFAADLA